VPCRAVVTAEPGEVLAKISNDPDSLDAVDHGGQNLQGRHSEARTEADFELTTQSEREIEVILQHLENQNELILKIVHHLEKQPG
jgi:hypothetical protein